MRGFESPPGQRSAVSAALVKTSAHPGIESRGVVFLTGHHIALGIPKTFVEFGTRAAFNQKQGLCSGEEHSEALTLVGSGVRVPSAPPQVYMQKP
jgi:hypothetical protein